MATWKFERSQPVHNEHDKAISQALAKLLDRDDLGFFQTSVIEESISQCQDLLLRKNWSQKKIVILGLGGSSLGAKALVEALNLNKDSQAVFLDNVDSHTIDNWLDQIEQPNEWLWYMCSKSGGTLETLALYDYCYQFFLEKRQFSIIDNTVVATEKKDSPLQAMAQEKQIPCLNVPFNVGGRFSVFTVVGLFPLLFLGASIDSFVKGCEKALSNKVMIEQILKVLLMAHKNQEMSFYHFSYCDRLVSWGLWLQQLWSESLGKKVMRDGQSADTVATLVPCRGASDQHSVLQQIVEGSEKKLVFFYRVEDSEQGQLKIKQSLFRDSLMVGRPIGSLLEIEAKATAQSITEAQQSTATMITSSLSEESLGELMMTWMLVIGAMGELLNIDAFDQPGVESGKVITRRVLSQSH